jgi:DNA gyrase subunit A
VLLTDGRGEILIATAQGQALRVAEADINPRGRTSSGIAGIRLAEYDHVADVCLLEHGGQVLIATQNGFAKRTDASEYPQQGRNTGGVIALHSRYQEATGPLVAARVVQPEDQVTLITAEGMALRTDVETIPESGRATRGQIVMNIRVGDRLSAVARLTSEAQAQGAD